MKSPVSIVFLCGIALYMLHNTASGQVKAAFSANTVQGCAPLVVQFTDQSTGNPGSWQWDLGNGTISLFQNPSTVYFLPGTYPVKLVVKNAAGADSLVKEQFITVYSNPKADFTAIDSMGCYPLKVAFTDRSAGNGRNIARWEWDFGDGSTSTEQTPSHIYLNSGNHTVTLKVITDKGCSHTFSREHFIRISSGVKSEFSDSAGKNCQAPMPVHFTNASEGPGNLSYTWDFGDGKQSVEKDPVHTYTSQGTFTVSLVTVSDAGCRDTLRKAGLVRVGTNLSQFKAPDSVCTGQSFSLTNTSSPVPAPVSWDFGDGSTSALLSPVKAYPSAGTYFIKLVNSFGHCVDSITKSVKVFAKPVAAFTADITNFCGIPATTQFTAGTNGIAYRWDFGDGSSGTGRDPRHTYTSFGIFTVKLFVTGAGGCIDSIVKKDLITVARPKIQLNGLPAGGCLPYTFPFSANITAQEDIVGWHWDFGDGTTSTLAAPEKTYTTEGKFTVKLVITTAKGCIDSVVVPNAIRVNTKPQVAFSADLLDVCAPQSVRFTNESTPAGTRWQWQFDVFGAGSTEENPRHHFKDTGDRTVKLIVWNNECADSLEKKRYIHVRPPIARFGDTMLCTDKYLRSFSNLSIGAKTWRWDFGDGTTSNEWSPTHRYAAKGSYFVSLVTTNDGCTDHYERTIVVADEHPDFTASKMETCKGETITFTTQGYNAGYISTVAWNFGDGTTSTAVDKVNRIYKNPGTYQVALRYTDVNGCADSIVKKQLIHVYGPTARFAPEQPTICAGTTANFRDQSKTDGIHPLSQWTWRYGDGITENFTSSPFIHVYADTGKYHVTLIVKDSRGCTDSISNRAAIAISRPVPAFASPDTNSCPGKPVSFANSSRGSGLQFRWDFGDGNSSTKPAPVHTYSTSGTYTVKLYATDMYGCIDSVIKENYVRITIPVARFTASDSVSSCPPLQVKFTSQAQNYTTLKWDFGDGSTSVLENPEHFYNTPGIFYVKQIIRGPGGCTDTAIRKMIVKGPQGSFTYAPLAGCKPLAVTMEAASQDKVSFVWDFNDGTVVPGNDARVQHTYTSAGNFIPKLILVDSTGCRVPVTGKDTLKVIGVTARATMDEYRLCDAGFIQFNDRSVANDYIVDHRWDFGDGNTSTLANPRHFFTTEGTYTIKHIAISAQGCADTVTLRDTIRVLPKPDVSITGKQEACEPVSLKFQANVLKGDASQFGWQWNFGNGKSDLRQQPDSQFYNAGNYMVQLQVVYKEFCRDTAYLPLTIRPLPATFAGNDTVVCRDRPVLLRATGADRYTWSQAPDISCTDCATPMINPVNNTQYVVTGHTAYGCVRTDTIGVRVRQRFDIQVQPGDTICQGQTLPLNATGAELYQWYPAAGLNNAGIANPKASPLQTTIYTVIGKDTDGCFADTAQVPIKVYPVPKVFAGNDTTITTGSALQLQTVNSPDINQWKWSPGEGLSCVDCPAPMTTVKGSVTYRVDVANEGGCRSSDDITVHAVCNTGNWFLPNTFSPNGDGTNDIFYVRGKGLNRIHSLKIFNRWGQLVFEKRDITPNDPAAGWDGTVNGKKADMDTYIYIVEVICDNSAIVPLKGDITLIR